MDIKWDSADYGIESTYRSLRYFAAVSLILMPALIPLVSGVPLQQSLSAYYFALPDGGTPRTLFVMFLSFLGCILLAYRGLTQLDNYIHNLAGVFSLAVALFPMACLQKHCIPGLGPTWIHGLSAGLMFAGALASVAYAGGKPLRDKLNEVGDQKLIDRLLQIRLLSGGFMLVGITAFVYGAIEKLDTPYVYWVEYLGFAWFGIYWLRLMILIDDLNTKDDSAPEGASRTLRLHAAKGGKARLP